MKFLWNDTPREIWDALTDMVAAPMQQRWIYGAVNEALGGQVLRLEVRRNGAPVAMAQFLTRRVLGLVGFGLASRGPIWIGPVPDEERVEILRQMRRELRARRVRFLLLTPEGEETSSVLNRAGLSDVMTPATVARLSLGAPLRPRMAQKWRNRLHAAERAKLSVRPIPGGYDRVAWLVAADQAQQKTRRYRALPPAFTAAWLQEDGASVVTLGGQMGGMRVAAMMFLCHGNTATYHLGWSGEDGRQVSAHNLLMLRGAERLAEAGMRELDLGTIDTVGAPGLARFKLGAGADAIPLGGTWLGM